MLIKDFSFQTILIDSRYFRKGILLKVRNQNNEEVSAEISPLPGHSKETLEQALQQLQSVKRRVLTTWWSKEALSHLNSWELYPSVHFGIQSALLDLLDPIEHAPECPTYALLIGTEEEILQRAEEVKKEGFTKAKVKLGHCSVPTAKRILDALSDTFELRIDLNRKWTLDESLSLCSHYPNGHFAYIEEPCSNPEELHLFPYPFALDETLREPYDLSPFLALPNLRALIIKPSLDAPIDRLLTLGKKVVITSCFEGPIGIRQVQRLIARLNLEPTTHHGLDTLRYLEETNVPNQVLEHAKT